MTFLHNPPVCAGVGKVWQRQWVLGRKFYQVVASAAELPDILYRRYSGDIHHAREAAGDIRTAKIFTTESGQSFKLPSEFRLEGREVFVRRDPKTGDVILSRKPDSWDGLLQLHQSADVPDDFMGAADQSQPQQDRDPFEGWTG
jgi:antitoxin VapB